MSKHVQQLAFRQVITAPRDLTANELIEVTFGGPVGWTDSDALAGEPVTVHLQGRVDGTNPSPSGTSATYAGEAWPTIGKSLYYNRLAAKVGLEATDQKLGHVMDVKPANDVQGCVFFDCCGRDDGEVLITLDFAHAEVIADGLGAIGDLIIDTGPLTIVSGEFRNSGLTSNSGSNLATVSVGDSGGTGVELMAATVVGALGAVTALNANIDITGNLIIRIAIEALDGGKFILKAVRSQF